MEIFLGRSGPNGGIFHTWQSVTGWAPWQHYVPPIAPTGGIAAARDSAGRVSVGWLSQGSLWVATASRAGAALSAPKNLQTQLLRTLTVATNQDGRVEFFSLDESGRVWSIAQNAVGSWDTSNVHNLDGDRIQRIAVTPYRDGRLALVALGGDGRVYWRSQKAPNAGWSDWSGLNGDSIISIAAAANADGRLEVLALRSDGHLHHTYETPPDNAWRAWRVLASGPFTGPLSFQRNQDGRLEAFARRNAEVVHTWQNGANQGWNGNVQVLTGAVPSASQSASLHNDDRRLALVVANANGDVRYTRQWSPNGSWAPWQMLPNPFPTPTPAPTPTPINPTPTVSETVWTVPPVNTGLTGQIAYAGTFPQPGLPYTGSAPDQWKVLEIKNVSQDFIAILKPNKSTTNCGDSSAVVPLLPQAKITPADMKVLFGSEQPKPYLNVVICGSLPQRLAIELAVRYER